MSEVLVGESLPALDSNATVQRIRFVPELAGGERALISFADPAPCFAVAAASSGSVDSDGALDVLLLPPNAPQPASAAGATIYVKLRGAEVAWRPGQATLQCEPSQVEVLLPALAEFAHYEHELRRIEAEVADNWAALEQDKALAFEAKPADLARSEAIGSRMNQAFDRRIRYARIEPHLYEPGATLSSAGQKLGAELRERARIESRLETIDAQLEVFEHIYEMSSQRLGEYRASHAEHNLEWIIIVLLAAELLALLVQMLWFKH